MTTLQFQIHGTDRSFSLSVRRLLVAGFTGRDAAGVQAHVDELRVLGVPVPDEVPTLMPLGPDLVTAASEMEVVGPFTSGEVEAVVVVHDGRRWLTVGSDHTDRDIERRSIPESKAACPKVIGRAVLALDQVVDLDAVEIESWADDDHEPYQRGTLAELLPLQDVERMLARQGVLLVDGDVLFLGSLPVVGGKLRPASRFRAELRDPASGYKVGIDYVVGDVDPVAPVKPELEFTPVEEVEWTPTTPFIPGQTERILARYGTTAIATRMLRFEPGTDTSAAGTLTHDFWEEVYILSGSLHDMALDQTFPAGTYACRPPGMPHGPWVSEEGCVTFEVRYPACGTGAQPSSVGPA